MLGSASVQHTPVATRQSEIMPPIAFGEFRDEDVDFPGSHFAISEQEYNPRSRCPPTKRSFVDCQQCGDPLLPSDRRWRSTASHYECYLNKMFLDRKLKGSDVTGCMLGRCPA